MFRALGLRVFFFLGGGKGGSELKGKRSKQLAVSSSIPSGIRGDCCRIRTFPRRPNHHSFGECSEL